MLFREFSSVELMNPELALQSSPQKLQPIKSTTQAAATNILNFELSDVPEQPYLCYKNESTASTNEDYKNNGEKELVFFDNEEEKIHNGDLFDEELERNSHPTETMIKDDLSCEGDEENVSGSYLYYENNEENLSNFYFFTHKVEEMIDEDDEDDKEREKEREEEREGEREGEGNENENENGKEDGDKERKESDEDEDEDEDGEIKEEGERDREGNEKKDEERDNDRNDEMNRVENKNKSESEMIDEEIEKNISLLDQNKLKNETRVEDVTTTTFNKGNIIENEHDEDNEKISSTAYPEFTAKLSTIFINMFQKHKIQEPADLRLETGRNANTPKFYARNFVQNIEQCAELYKNNPIFYAKLKRHCSSFEHSHIVGRKHVSKVGLIDLLNFGVIGGGTKAKFKGKYSHNPNNNKEKAKLLKILKKKVKNKRINNDKEAAEEAESEEAEKEDTSELSKLNRQAMNEILRTSMKSEIIENKQIEHKLSYLNMSKIFRLRCRGSRLIKKLRAI